MSIRSALLLLLPLALVHVSPAYAQWLPDGNALCTALQDQFTPVIVSDGAGGAIVAWQDGRDQPETHIYVQRISGTGAALWTGNGVALCLASGGQLRPTIVTDGAGGAIVAWEDLRPDDLDGIYVQRVDAAGVPQWASDGVRLSTAAGTQGEPEGLSDGAGGAFVVWTQSFGPLPSVYGRRVDAAGTPQWANEIPVCAQVSAAARIISDGVGGAIIAWEDYRNAFVGSGSTDVFAQRVNAAGTPLWTADGVGLCTATGRQHSIVLTTDGAAGAIVGWVDQRNVTYNTYARRIDASGTPQWAPDGVQLTLYDGLVRDATTIATDGAGGAIVAWLDDSGAQYFDLQAQRVDAAGTPLWDEENGVFVCNAVFDQKAPRMLPDGAGGAIVTWQDQRSGNPTYDDIYAQRLNASGVGQWALNGVVVCDAVNEQWAPVIAPDGGGGAVIAWQDRVTTPTTGFDIYANRIGPLGLVPTGVRGASPTPSLVVGSAYPNPFSHATSLDIALQATSDVRIDVVDVSGRRVRRMMLRSVPDGALRVDFDGRDDRGSRLANGVYFCKVSVAGTTVTRKVVLIR